MFLLIRRALKTLRSGGNRLPVVWFAAGDCNTNLEHLGNRQTQILNVFQDLNLDFVRGNFDHTHISDNNGALHKYDFILKPTESRFVTPHRYSPDEVLIDEFSREITVSDHLPIFSKFDLASSLTSQPTGRSKSDIDYFKSRNRNSVPKGWKPQDTV